MVCDDASVMLPVPNSPEFTKDFRTSTHKVRLAAAAVAAAAAAAAAAATTANVLIAGAESKAISLLVGLGFTQDMLHMPVKSFRHVCLCHVTCDGV